MSLQVWLPFTDGTLKQQGLKNVSATIGGTINLTEAGKLGKCATIGTTAGGITLPASTMTSFTECSVAFWINIAAWNTNWDTFFQAGLGSTPWNNYIFGILRNQGDYLCFTISNGSSTSSGGYASSNLTIGQWMHLAFTYGSGKCKIYINGVLDKEYSTSITPNFAGITHIAIGRSTNGSNYQSKCKLNDFRIYDHCLSPMEVKQISQGLVLHYPLNRNGWGQENLLLSSNVEKTVSSSIIEWSLDNDAKANIKEKTYVISADIKCSSNNSKIDCYVRSPSTSQSMSPATVFTGITTEYKRYFLVSSCTVSLTGTPTTFCFNCNGRNGSTTGVTFSIKNVKLEYGDKVTSWCPNSSDVLATIIGLNSATEYDCSGFCNNGTRVGDFTWTSDTPKYNVSTHIGANTQKIHISNFPTSGFGNSYSFVWWGKRASNTPMFWGFSDGIRLNGMYNGTLWNTGDSSNNPIYRPGTTTTITAPSVNTWHHYVMTGDGTTCKLYVDGELYGQAKTYKAISGTSIYINGWDASTAYCDTNANISDFRIYATALSADDVRALYENSAYIANNGTTYAYEFIEE